MMIMIIIIIIIWVKLDNKHWYDHVPKSVETSHEFKFTILWIQQVRTDRTINKQDTIIRDNKQGTRLLLDVAILERETTMESAKVKVQNIFDGRNNITCSTNCKYRTAGTLCTLETWIVSSIYCKYSA
jgi:hypothetical protein